MMPDRSLVYEITPAVVVSRSQLKQPRDVVRLISLARWIGRDWGDDVEIINKDTGRTWLTVHD